MTTHDTGNPTVELDVSTNHRVGPMTDMYGHGPVTVIQEDEVSDHDTDDGVTVFVCLDCGFTTDDNRLLSHVDCDREHNEINTTWRERIEDRGFPEQNDTEGPWASNG